MFNALNRYLSRLDGGDNQQGQQGAGQEYGFQVLRNTNLELGVEPWFDFVVGINGRMIDNPDPRLFAQEVRNCAGNTVSLGLWSAKGQRIRTMHIPVSQATGTLGLSLQWAPLSLASTIWHVLDVPANSPADLAGLLPYSDYILGTPDGILHGEGGLGELVDDYVGRPLRLWVYNNEYNVTREVEIVPSREWGGQGALGCVLGYGALHRLPAPLDEPVSAPGETLFDGGGAAATHHHHHHPGDQFSTLAAPPPNDALGFVPPGYNDNNNNSINNTFVPAEEPGAEAQESGFLIPANMVSPPPPPMGGGTSAPPRGKKKGRHVHGTNPNKLMDDYLAEEEKKSKELDGHISASRTPPPPPPKAGAGPPKTSGPPPPQVEEETPAAGENEESAE